MNNDNFTTAARAKAERRADLAAEPLDFEHGLIEKDFLAGAEWARTYLAAQEPTDAEVETMARMTTEEVSGCDWARFGEDARNYHRETARRRLTAARAARRDERDTP